MAVHATTAVLHQVIFAYIATLFSSKWHHCAAAATPPDPSHSESARPYRALEHITLALHFDDADVI